MPDKFLIQKRFCVPTKVNNLFSFLYVNKFFFCKISLTKASSKWLIIFCAFQKSYIILQFTDIEIVLTQKEIFFMTLYWDHKFNYF